MTDLRVLLNEYKQLKAELFDDEMFVIEDGSDENAEKWKRHDQLQAYFYPQFRTENWTQPTVK